MRLSWWDTPPDGYSDLAGVWIDGVPYRMASEPPVQGPTVSMGHGVYAE